MMTSLEYEAIAAAVADSLCSVAGRPDAYSYGVHNQYVVMANKIAGVLEDDSLYFDREKFMKTCGLDYI